MGETIKMFNQLNSISTNLYINGVLLDYNTTCLLKLYNFPFRSCEGNGFVCATGITVY